MSIVKATVKTEAQPVKRPVGRPRKFAPATSAPKRKAEDSEEGAPLKKAKDEPAVQRSVRPKRTSTIKREPKIEQALVVKKELKVKKGPAAKTKPKVKKEVKPKKQLKEKKLPKAKKEPKPKRQVKSRIIHKLPPEASIYLDDVG